VNCEQVWVGADICVTAVIGACGEGHERAENYRHLLHICSCGICHGSGVEGGGAAGESAPPKDLIW